ncbi:DUF721 domain-containing protein [Candidatus Peregrinibacteria bacterium]|nr:DUF721 domain-containing protein [Candidatus Peregrinibacteria bacterium]
MWENLTSLIPDAAKKYNFTRTLKAIEICQQFRSLSKNILPPNFEKHADARSFEEGTLTIEVYNSGWSQQVQMNKHKIQEAMNQKFGQEIIKNIRIKMAEKPQEQSEF